MDLQALSLEEQVAQLFMVGYGGAYPNPVTRRFLQRGVGGLIFFRDNFDPLTDARAVADLLADLTAAVPPHVPAPLMGIDQEGGQVERLPHRYFPTALTPRAVALAKEPETLAGQMYGMMARHLRQLGFTLDFFPTLDVNLNPENPIIGVRSFGNDPKTVWRLGQIALDAFRQSGIVAVGKHFPGHGNGTVDSHLDLPTLQFTETELQPFQQAIGAGLPAMLVAHGFYPALQTTEAEKALPSSASPAIIQGLLRNKLGFDGVLITDDMCMGAITRHRNPVEAAILSLRAGLDILLYKQSTADEWAVYEAVLAAFRSGELPLAQLEQSLARIAKLKQWLHAQPRPQFREDDFSPALGAQKADDIAMRGIGLLGGDADLLPLHPEGSLLLIHPDRAEMGNYALDMPTSDDLPTVLRQTGFVELEALTYPPKTDFSPHALLESPQSEPSHVCMVSFSPCLQPAQAGLYTALKTRFPQAKIILVSAGMPDTPPAWPPPDLHLSLCSYRPASMRALAQVLKTGLSV